MIRTMRYWIFGISGIASLLLLAAASGMMVAASQEQAPEEAREQRPAVEVALEVGTFDPEVTFQQYYRTGELFELFQEIQPEAQQAQQAGDQGKLVELQSRLEAKQAEILEAFEAELDEAMPDVADEAGVKVIAVQIRYSAPDVEATDLTSEIVARINVDAPEPAEPAEDPFFPPAPPR